MKSKYIFLLFWLLLIALPVYSVIKNSNMDLVFSKQTLTINFIQRLTGLVAFALLPLQITLGAFMTKLAEKYGSWIFWFHITQAILIYILVFAHPVLFLILRWKSSGVFDPFYVFLGFCLLCSSKFELYLTMGRIAFVFLTIGYLVGKFRTLVFLRKHWKWLHYFNYLAFFLVAFHALKLGSDTLSSTFGWYFVFAHIWVLGVIFLKIFHKFRKK